VSTSPSLEGCWAKIRRAEQHLKSLHEEIGAFIDSDPHQVVERFDLETSTYEMRIEVERSPDDSAWGALVGDFVQNLRASLDHLVWQLVLLNGERKPSNQNQFPIVMSESDYWESRKGKPSLRDRMLAGVAEEHRARIDLVQPYRRGDRAAERSLAYLRWLSNVDKHRALHTTLFTVKTPRPEDLIVEADDEFRVIEFEINSGALEHGAHIMRARMPMDSQAKVQMKGEIEIGIGFGERGGRASPLSRSTNSGSEWAP
jgi:hypothetical protein